VNFSKGARFQASPKYFFSAIAAYFRQDSAKHGKKMPAFGKVLPCYYCVLPNRCQIQSLRQGFAAHCRNMRKSLPQLPNGLITGTRNFNV